MRKEKNKQGWTMHWMLIAFFVLLGPTCYCQDVLFFDDFSGDLSNWQELGNSGSPEIMDGELVLEWGYAPNWLVTQETFNFGSEAIRFDFTFVGGGYQATYNYKQNYIRPVFGANDPGEEGAIRSAFSADFFELERRVANEEGEMGWDSIPSADEEEAQSIEPGDRIRFEIAPSAQEGELFVNGASFLKFMTEPVMEGGFGFRVVTETRDIIIDDVFIRQVDETGDETVVLEDDFERDEVGENWVNETLAEDSSPGALSATIQEGQLYLDNDGSGDAWLRTAEPLELEGKTTIFEYTFVDFMEGSERLPASLLGTKPYEAGSTSGVILVDNGSNFNYGMVDGGWSAGQASTLGGNRQGMRFQIVIDEGGQSGTVYRDGVEGLNFINIGPPLSGGIAFRTIVDRDAVIDDIRIYTIEEDGSETTIFEDDFNRDELGDDWASESITPDVPPGAQWALLEDRDEDGDNELFLDHDSTDDDAWCRLKKELPFGEGKPVVIEGTFVSFVDYASVAIGTEEWVANETVGPILLDNLNEPWVMDTLGGNVWVRPGPISGSTLSFIVNSDGRSGSFLVNDVVVREWEFAEGEEPVLPGHVGFDDPFSEPQVNTSPPAEPDTPAKVRYDDFRVTQLETTAIQHWMIH